VEYYDKQIREVRKFIRIAQESVKHPLTKVAFITCKTMRQACTVAQIQLNDSFWHMKPAPDPQDVNWTRIRRKKRSVGIIIFLIIAGISIFFGAITGTIIGLTSLKTLSKVEWLHWLEKILSANELVVGFIQVDLPNCFVLFFFILSIVRDIFQLLLCLL